MASSAAVTACWTASAERTRRSEASRAFSTLKSSPESASM